VRPAAQVSNLGMQILDHHLLRCEEGLFWLDHLAWGKFVGARS
jgi:hypothetical protein